MCQLQLNGLENVKVSINTIFSLLQHAFLGYRQVKIQDGKSQYKKIMNK